MTFSEKVRTAQLRNDSWLCIGLDTDPDRIPSILRTDPDPVVTFNRSIIQATSDLVSAYKPNLAFYLAHGSAGIDALKATVAAIPSSIPIILDAKFGDIESTAVGYARFVFEWLGADAVTVSPFLGGDALSPFLAYSDHAILLLAHTSNPDARQFQDALMASKKPGEQPSPLFLVIAQYAHTLRGRGETGLVVGATFPQQLRLVRQTNPNAVFLVPGIGAQGGTLEETVEFGVTGSGIGPIINASRSILYASSGDDFAEAARAAAIKMRDNIRQRKDFYEQKTRG